MYRAIVIFGPPGSGKGTIGKAICEVGRLFHFSSGDMFRAMDRGSDLGKEIGALMDAGQFVSDELTVALVQAYLGDCVKNGRYDPENQLIMCDGIPRTVSQVDLIKPFIDVQFVIQLQVPDKQVLINRIMGRAKIEGRSDDMDLKVLEERFSIFENLTAQVVSQYPSDRVYTFNADQKPLKVLRDVLDTVSVII